MQTESFLSLASIAQVDAIQKSILQFLPIAIFVVILSLIVYRQAFSDSTRRAPAGGFSWRGVILISVAFILILFAVLFRTPEKPSETDRANVVAVMESMYTAATNDDIDRWHTIAAPGFYAFDNGQRFEGDALMQLIRKLHAQGRTYRWQVTEPEVHVNGSMAWITYVNKGSVQDATGSKDMTWLESAILRKEKDGWRMQFFHSTRVPE
ncbi:MAG: hypothetical protein QOH24_631 [Verrucomicrobiota bacterium]|jgi:hypothetical protein